MHAGNQETLTHELILGSLDTFYYHYVQVIQIHISPVAVFFTSAKCCCQNKQAFHNY